MICQYLQGHGYHHRQKDKKAKKHESLDILEDEDPDNANFDPRAVLAEADSDQDGGTDNALVHGPNLEDSKDTTDPNSDVNAAEYEGLYPSKTSPLILHDSIMLVTSEATDNLTNDDMICHDPDAIFTDKDGYLFNADGILIEVTWKEERQKYQKSNGAWLDLVAYPHSLDKFDIGFGDGIKCQHNAFKHWFVGRVISEPVHISHSPRSQALAMHVAIHSSSLPPSQSATALHPLPIISASSSMSPITMQ